ncbi:MAG: cysteine desulfurase [Bacteriovoracaceae bacterium]|nr:cysteine desulfurase [Bacteriovoracaceae bacterium]
MKTLQQIRDDFPLLKRQVHNKPLIYLDSAATTLKPLCVTESITRYYTEETANIHRGVHFLSEISSERYEHTREIIKDFIQAESTQEIIFTAGTTASINLIVSSFGKKYIEAGDEILISAMEHHSNIVPWQMLCEEKKARLKVIPMDHQGVLNLETYKTLLTTKTKIVAVAHVSNALGTVNPIKEMIALAHAKNIPVLVDGAQAIAHLQVNVQDLDADFYAFSAHKLYGPTGCGVLYGKKKWLENLPPYQGGGDMIASVTFEKTTYNELPFKFEAGTPAIASVIGMGVAIEYIKNIGWDFITKHEKEILNYAHEKLSQIPFIKIIGTAPLKSGAISFIMEHVHPHDIGTMADQEGVALRTGHHCAQPVMNFFGIPATARASFGIYNNKEDVDHLIFALKKIGEFFL